MSMNLSPAATASVASPGATEGSRVSAADTHTPQQRRRFPRILHRTHDSPLQNASSLESDPFTVMLAKIHEHKCIVVAFCWDESAAVKMRRRKMLAYGGEEGDGIAGDLLMPPPSIARVTSSEYGPNQTSETQVDQGAENAEAAINSGSWQGWC